MLFGTAYVFLGVLILVLGRCPTEYKRLSQKHTYCLPANESCSIARKGISEEDKSLILHMHNEMRNKIATGEVESTAGLPSSSNMLQMVWDEKLAEIAQKWVEQCNFKHDCRACKAIRDFAVRQNLWRTNTTLGDGDMSDEAVSPDWLDTINSWIKQVGHYDRNSVGSYSKGEFGHFTQVIWADTWRVGCGFTAYKDGNKMYRYYACNYGPGGNNIGSPVYKEGSSCSECPINSCCGKTCSSSNPYPTLCRMLNNSEAPVYKTSKPFLLDCHDITKCATNVEGVNKWLIVPTLSGNYATIILEGGESAILQFRTGFISEQRKYCLVVRYRHGPNVAGQKDAGVFRTVSKTNHQSHEFPVSTDIASQKDRHVQMRISVIPKIYLSFSFEVPKGAPPQYLEISKVYIYDGQCN